MKKVFVVILFALFLMPRVDAQVLKSYEELSNKMGKYVLEVPQLKGTNIISGDMLPLVEENGITTWSKIEIFDSDGNGLVEYTYIGWNILLKCYWTSLEKKWNPLLAKQPCFDEESGLLLIGLVDGQIITNDLFKPLFLGQYGDSYIGVDVDKKGGKVYLYFNYNTMTIIDPAMVPFVQLSSRKWKEKEVTIINSWGWGCISEDLDHVFYQDENGEKYYNVERLGFGAYLPSGEKTWPKGAKENSILLNPQGTFEVPIITN